MGQLWMQISGESGSVFNANQQPAASKAFDLISSAANTEQVRISEELKNLFGSNGCDLGKKIQEKIDKDNRKGIIPKELQVNLGEDLEREARKVANQSVQAALHVIQASEGGNSAWLLLEGTDTYNNMPAIQFVNEQYKNLAFTMDCSGYLTAALSAGSGISGASAKAAAESVAKSSKSLVVIDAAVSSPVALAINPASGTVKLSTVNRLDILYSIANEARIKFPNASDAMNFTSWRALRMMWTSNQGSSSLQGATTVSASAGVGVVSASVSGAASMSKGITFKSFNTYILDESLNGSIQITFAALKKLIGELVAKNLPSAPATRVGSNYVATYPGLPQSICALNWSVATVDNVKSDGLAGSINSVWDKEGCRVTYSPKNASAPGAMLSLVALSGFDVTQTLNLPLPVFKD